MDENNIDKFLKELSEEKHFLMSFDEEDTQPMKPVTDVPNSDIEDKPNAVAQAIRNGTGNMQNEIVVISHEGTFVIGVTPFLAAYYDFPKIVFGYTKYMDVYRALIDKGFEVFRRSYDKLGDDSGIILETITFYRPKPQFKVPHGV